MGIADTRLNELIESNNLYIKKLKEKPDPGISTDASVFLNNIRVFKKNGKVNNGETYTKHDRLYTIKKLNLRNNISLNNLAIAVHTKTKTAYIKNNKGRRQLIADFANGKKMKLANNDDFYRSREWRQLRFKVLIKYGRRCMCCGATPENNNIVIHVDHIKPRSKFPKLELDINNLQVLCEDCNLGKSNVSNEDFRPMPEIELTENMAAHMQAIKADG